MMRGFMPFLPRFYEPIETGDKTKTFRSKKYGEVGDVLDTAVGPIRITQVERVTAATVRDHHWKEEGAVSPQEFVDIWLSIHSRSAWSDDRRGWLHTFQRLNTVNP